VRDEEVGRGKGLGQRRGQRLGARSPKEVDEARVRADRRSV